MPFNKKTKIILLSFLVLFSCLGLRENVWAVPGKSGQPHAPHELKKTLVGVWYFNQIFGQIHEQPSKYSNSITTISCGHPIKVFEIQDKVLNGWTLVQASGYEGYLWKEFLSQMRPECFQQKYPVFFNAMEMDLTDTYFWGRIFDHYITVKTGIND